MKIVIGSLNETKVGAVEKIFPDKEVIAVSVPSGVSSQPVGDEETREGAVHRAQLAQRHYPNSVGIGLEGGVMYLKQELYLCNWGALLARNGEVFTASGARIKLPASFKNKIDEGEELSDIMNEYTSRQNIRNHEGAIGIFTNQKMLRKEMFAHVLTLLRGQMEYWKQ